MKSVLIIGLGRFGRHMAQKFIENGHEVMAIDINEDRADDAVGDIQQILIGDATEERFMESIGVRNFDLAVCPMNNPQKNSRQVLAQFGKESDSPYQALGGEEYDALLSGTGSLSARQQAEQWLFQNGVVLPLYEARAYYVYDTKLSGLSVDPVTRVVDFTKTLKF